MIGRRASDLNFGFSLAAIAVLAMIATPNVCGQEETEPQAAAWSFVFRVVDEDGVTLKDATIKTKLDKTSNSHQQLPNGDLQIALDSKPKYFLLECQAEGRSPINASWRDDEIPESSGKPFVVTLPAPKPISGRIVDQAGDSIEGVTVRVFATSYGQRLKSAVWDFLCKTDAEGRWSCPVAPSKLRRLRIHVEHPEYASDQFYGKDPFIEDLQTCVHIGKMRKRATVTGSVTGSDGQPVAKAVVSLGSKLSKGVPRETETDQEGRYAFTNCTEGDKKLTVFAKHLAPELVELTVDEDFVGPVDVELTSGETVTIKVVDHKGDPISQAQIVFNGWRGLSSLYDKDLSSLVTDENGIFVLENAPEGAAMFDVRASGFQNQGWVKYTAGEEPVIAKLFPPLFASGSVVDAKTGKPIERFRIVAEHHESSGRATSTRRKTGKGGRYAFELTRPSETYRLVIKADGYSPQRSPLFKRGEGDVSFNFKLGQTYGVQGKVVSPDGVLVEGATVALTAKKFQTLRLNNGRIENLDNFVSASTKADGCFSLVADKKEWLVYVCHELGFARINGAFSEAGHEVKLSPWASIAGKDLKSDGRETSVQVVLSGIEKIDKRIKQQATTNSDGEFEINKVAPGIQYSIERRITRFINLDGKRRRTRQVVARLDAVAGTNVVLGQSGRKIVGKIVCEDRWWELVGFAKAKPQRPKYPDGFDDWDVARKRQWKSDWSKTEAGTRYHTNRSLEYPIKFNGERFTDESDFEIESLPPGFYEVSIQLKASRGESHTKKRKLHVKKITAEERDPQPQDMGVIEFSHPSSDE